MDASLQALERRWRQTGALEDEARWLQGRLRAGALGRERVVFAADLGHAAAQVALDRPVDLEGPIELLRGGDPSPRALGRLGREGLVRVTLAAIEAHAELVERHVGPVHRVVRGALAAVRAWRDSAPPRPGAAVEAHAQPLWAVQGGPGRAQHTTVLLARRLVEGVTAPRPQAARALELALRIVTDWSAMLEERRAPAPRSLVDALAALGGERPRDGYERLLLRRVQDDVVPWALA